jgi:hypothetical protein
MNEPEGLLNRFLDLIIVIPLFRAHHSHHLGGSDSVLVIQVALLTKKELTLG